MLAPHILSGNTLHNWGDQVADRENTIPPANFPFAAGDDCGGVLSTSGAAASVFNSFHAERYIPEGLHDHV